MEISKLKHAQIKRRCFVIPVQTGNTNPRAVYVVNENTGLGPVYTHHLPIESSSDVGHEAQALRCILCPFDSLCTGRPQILASVKHLVAFFVADQQFSSIR